MIQLAIHSTKFCIVFVYNQLDMNIFTIDVIVLNDPITLMFHSAEETSIVFHMHGN